MQSLVGPAEVQAGGSAFPDVLLSGLLPGGGAGGECHTLSLASRSGWDLGVTCALCPRWHQASLRTQKAGELLAEVKL